VAITHRRPKYVQIKDCLKGKLLSGVSKPGERFYSEGDISREFSVSNVTARRVLNELETEGLVVRKQGSGTYVSDVRAARTMTLGMIFPSVTDGHSARLLHKIERSAAGYGYAVVVQNSEDRVATHVQCCRALAERAVDGVFLHMPQTIRPGEIEDVVSSLKILEASTRGIVAFEYSPDALPYKGRICAVHEDYKQAGFDLTSHLIEQGHRRIAVIDVEHTYTTNQRFFGYWQALRRAELEFDPQLHMIVQEESPDETVKRILGIRPQVTAVLALSDHHARMLLKEFVSKGIKVPDDISLAGYDDLEFASLMEPPLTTITPPSEQIAAEAMDLMMKMLDDPKASPMTVVLPPKVVIRRSTVGTRLLKSCVSRQQFSGLG